MSIDIFQDEDFKKQPYEVQRDVAQNYFDQELADEEFSALDPQMQDEIKTNFMKSQSIYDDSAEIADTQPKLFSPPPMETPEQKRIIIDTAKEAVQNVTPEEGNAVIGEVAKLAEDATPEELQQVGNLAASIATELTPEEESQLITLADGVSDDNQATIAPTADFHETKADKAIKPYTDFIVGADQHFNKDSEAFSKAPAETRIDIAFDYLKENIGEDYAKMDDEDRNTVLTTFLDQVVKPQEGELQDQKNMMNMLLKFADKSLYTITGNQDHNTLADARQYKQDKDKSVGGAIAGVAGSILPYAAGGIGAGVIKGLTPALLTDSAIQGTLSVLEHGRDDKALSEIATDVAIDTGVNLVTFGIVRKFAKGNLAKGDYDAASQQLFGKNLDELEPTELTKIQEIEAKSKAKIAETAKTFTPDEKMAADEMTKQFDDDLASMIQADEMPLKAEVPTTAKTLQTDEAIQEVKSMPEVKAEAKPEVIEPTKDIREDPLYFEVIDRAKNRYAKDMQNANIRLQPRSIKHENVPGEGWMNTVNREYDTKNYDFGFELSRADVGQIKKGNITPEIEAKIQNDMNVMRNDPTWAKDVEEIDGIGNTMFAIGGGNATGGAMGGGVLGGAEAAYEDIVEGKDLSAKEYLARIAAGAAGGAVLGKKFGGSGKSTNMFVGAKGDDAGAFSNIYDKGVRKWIDDGSATLIEKRVLNDGFGGMPLSDFLKHDKLYTEFPQAKNIKTTINIDPSNNPSGFYDTQTNRMVVNAPTIEEARSIILHEVQHKIQSKEGWARGGSADNIGDFMGNKISEYNDNLKSISKEIDNITSLEYTNPKNLTPSEVSHNLNTLKEKYDNIMDEKLSLISKTQKDKFKLYKSLAGEQEARATQAALKHPNTEPYTALAKEEGKLPQPIVVGNTTQTVHSSTTAGSAILGGAIGGIDTDEKGNITFDATKALIGGLSGAALGWTAKKGYQSFTQKAKFPAGVLPPETKWQKTQRTLQDKFNRVQQLIDVKAGKQGVDDAMNPYQAEELYHGRAATRMENFTKKITEPFMKKLSDSSHTMDELDDYLIAKHATERNAEMLKRSGMENGSGMTDAEAAGILKQYDTDEMKGLANYVYSMNKTRLSLLKQEGLESQEYIDMLSGGYEYYVPLKRDMSDMFNMREGIRTGKGFDIKGKEFKRAMGSQREVESPIVHSILGFQESLVRSEKNKVGKSFLEFTEKFPDESLYEVKSLQYMPKFDKNGAIVQMDPAYTLADNVLHVKVDGKIKQITIKDEALASAFKNLNPTQMNAAMKIAHKAVRFLASVSTQYNPEFVLSNFSRDIQTAMLNLPKEMQPSRAAMAKDVMPSIKGIFQEERGMKSGEWGKLFKELKAEGGTTGWMEQYGTEDMVKNLTDEIEMLQGGKKTRKAFNSLLNFVDHTNNAVENGVRLVAYKQAKASGLSNKKAASIAKNLTVNFNRKGEMGTFFNTLYMFSNASIQGTTRMVKSLATSRKAQIGAAGIVGIGASLDMYNNAVAKDDYRLLPNYIKDTNIVIMKGGEGGEFYKIPLPYGYNVFKVLGDMSAEKFRGEESHSLTTRVLGAVVSAFSPIGADANMVHTIVPTLGKLPYELQENQNFFGGKIRPEPSQYGSNDKANAYQYSKSVNPLLRDASKKLNEATGGNYVTSGLIDISPENIEHTVEFIGGGLGKLVSNTLHYGMDKVTGEKTSINKVPFARKFQGELYEKADMGATYDSLDRSSREEFKEFEVKNFERDMKAALKEGQIDEDRYEKSTREFTKRQIKVKWAKENDIQGEPTPEQTEKLDKMLYEGIYSNKKYGYDKGTVTRKENELKYKDYYGKAKEIKAAVKEFRDARKDAEKENGSKDAFNKLKGDKAKIGLLKQYEIVKTVDREVRKLRKVKETIEGKNMTPTARKAALKKIDDRIESYYDKGYKRMK